MDILATFEAIHSFGDDKNIKQESNMDEPFQGWQLWMLEIFNEKRSMGRTYR